MWASGLASVAVCDRCQRKLPYQSLKADGNSPGLRVCEDCYDPLNPWRLPPIQPDPITLRYPRPEPELNAGVSYPDVTNPVNPVPPNEGDYPTKE